MTESPARIMHMRFKGAQQSACGQQQGMPNSWQPGHWWVWSDQAQFITCPQCKELAMSDHDAHESPPP
jgi:hypothetical protein